MYCVSTAMSESEVDLAIGALNETLRELRPVIEAERPALLSALPGRSFHLSAGGAPEEQSSEQATTTFAPRLPELCTRHSVFSAMWSISSTARSSPSCWSPSNSSWR